MLRGSTYLVSVDSEFLHHTNTVPTNSSWVPAPASRMVLIDAFQDLKPQESR